MRGGQDVSPPERAVGEHGRALHPGPRRPARAGDRRRAARPGVAARVARDPRASARGRERRRRSRAGGRPARAPRARSPWPTDRPLRGRRPRAASANRREARGAPPRSRTRWCGCSRRRAAPAPGNASTAARRAPDTRGRPRAASSTSVSAVATYAAAMRPEDSARCTPVENRGSMKHAASPQRIHPGPTTRSET